MTQTLLTKLLQPLRDIIAPQAETINQQYPSEKLFYADFVAKLLFGYLYQVPSLRMLALELKSNDVCRELGLSYTPLSTLKDGFARFPSYLCRQLFETVVVQSKLAQVGPLAEMGVFRVVDGSFFPTLLTMGWTAYRKTKNACKLHLSFDLNQMIPAEFWVSSGKASERKFLLGILETGLTYIADRGYFGFDVMAKIMQAKAFFVLRGKEKVLYRIVEKLPVVANLPSCFRALTA